MFLLIETFDIAGYCRISVDEELNRDNTSIENQKVIISEYVKTHFPGSTLTFYEDRDRSGYTFEQREGYQRMRKELISHQKDILIVKDFSRFSRRNGRGLVELEDLRDYGLRIISIGDNTDYPNDDDWMKIQFQFMVNEFPVTDTSKKVKSVIKRRQADGKWICAAPYGYIVNKQQQFEIVPVEAEIIRQIYQMYLNGWGYKKIANYLTSEKIPTPRMAEQTRKESAGEEYRRSVKPVWSIVTIQGILDNDFYIGTLRQGKYTRRKINGAEIKQSEDSHLVFENHHQAIIDYRTFATVRSLRQKRTRSNYRGIKVYDNIYSGFLFCGDCGSPMFSMSRADLKEAYRCGAYHRQGLAACTSHHIRVDRLNEMVKAYVRKIQENSSEMLEQLNVDLEKEAENLRQTEKVEENLSQILEDLQEELKATKRQRIRDIMKHPDQEETLEETYDELEADLIHRIEGINHQIELAIHKQNTIIQVNRAAKTAMDVFEDILNKEKLERNDLEILIEKIMVFEDHIEVQLKADVDSLLRCGELPEEAANFKSGTKNIENLLIQSSANRKDKVFRVNVISEGDPLEIYTTPDGEVIFKKYSPMGEISNYAGVYADVLSKMCGVPAVVCDHDHVIAAAGVSKKDWLEHRITPALEQAMDARKCLYGREAAQLHPVEGTDKNALSFCPILVNGDIAGGIVLLATNADTTANEIQQKLAQTAAALLSRQLEE